MEVNTFVDEHLEGSLYAPSQKGSDSNKSSVTINQKT